jgi:hypothetical protein
MPRELTADGRPIATLWPRPDASDAAGTSRPWTQSVTFRVDAMVLLYAAARAFREGTSLNALVNACLEEYSDLQPPEWARPRRRAARRGYPRFVVSKGRSNARVISHPPAGSRGMLEDHGRVRGTDAALDAGDDGPMRSPIDG